MDGKITEIQTMGTEDGPGIRLVLFMAGCPLRCIYCHNPETWQISADSRTISPEELLKKYKRNEAYYGERGGITFSGGEPLTQSKFLLEAVKLFKQNGIHVALDTSGVGDDYEETLKFVDLIILDIKATSPAEYEEITGKSIQKFTMFLDYAKSLGKKFWLRQVIVPGLNDDESHILALKDFAKTIPNVERIELLPYHTMGESKYERLNIPYRLKGVPAMDKQRCKDLEKLLR